MKIWPSQSGDFKPPLMSPKANGGLWFGLSGVFFALAASSYFIAIEAHMFQRRTFKFFVSLIGLFLVLASPALIWPDYLDSPLGLALAIPYLSIYLFDQIGIPGLLQNNGACGWGWCAPTAFGWVFLVTFWLSVTWLLAWGLSSLIQPSGEADQANCPATQPDDQAH